MTQVRIKRVYESPAPADGFRVFVDKLWPRGLKKEDLHADLWEKEIAPSTPLRQWFHQDEAGRWDAFAQKYTEELKHSAAMQAFVDKVRGQDTITLLYASHNATENQAVVLKKYIEEELR